MNAIEGVQLRSWRRGGGSVSRSSCIRSGVAGLSADQHFHWQYCADAVLPYISSAEPRDAVRIAVSVWNGLPSARHGVATKL